MTIKKPQTNTTRLKFAPTLAKTHLIKLEGIQWIALCVSGGLFVFNSHANNGFAPQNLF